MRTPGSWAMAIGFTVMLLSVSAGMHMHSGAGGFGLLLSFTGVLASAYLVAAGVRMANVPAATFPAAFGGAPAPAAFVRRNTAAVGLVMASCAVTAVSGETEPVLCFAMFALLLLGVSLINVGAHALNCQSDLQSAISAAATAALSSLVLPELGWLLQRAAQS